MCTKLTATALGIALAFGTGIAVAADNATIYQNGNNNDSTIQQLYNNGADATVTTFGNDNENSVIQSLTGDTSATILTSSGSFNDNTILQDLIRNSSASIFQSANGGETHITQIGAWLQPSSNLSASISQTAAGGWFGDWGNVAAIQQTGHNASATLNQSGSFNEGVIIQDGGNGNTWATAEMYQTGWNNSGNITQDGTKLWAKVTQSGLNNVASIDQVGFNLNAQLTQLGSANNASIVQR